MNDLVRNLYTAAQVRELDRRAIVEQGIAGYTLMQRAARACWRLAREQAPPPRALTVVCGPGNNGGDGYEIARLARAEGCAVQVFAVGALPQGGDAGLACAAWRNDGGGIEPFNGHLADADWVIDAIFGTGLSRPLPAAALSAVQAMSALRGRGARILSVDVPTGLDASTGALPSQQAVAADATMSFIGRKLGLYTGQGPAFAGALHFDALAVPERIYQDLAPAARLQTIDDLRPVLPRRARTAHKGDNGHLLLVGGNHGMVGAVLIAARAALRAGAGLVSVATRSGHAAALTAVQPELMARACEGCGALRALIARADVIAIGPGLGTDDWAREVWSTVLDSGKPLVIDADALNLLAADAVSLVDAILTPHPGEAAQLLGCSTATVQADRLAALQAIEQRYAATVVLKGAGSLVGGSPVPLLCPYGNPGMAAGGMGDALTGTIAALRAQGLGAAQAAQAGVLAHAIAGDRAARDGERGLLPSDLIAELRGVVNPAP